MDEMFGKNEAEIEEEIQAQLQNLAKETIAAALAWMTGWKDGRGTVQRKVVNALNARLELILLNAITSEVQAKALAIASAAVAEKFTEEYIRSNPRYAASVAEAEFCFWNDFAYKMRDCARKAAETSARAGEQAFEKSMTTLIKTSILNHFAASDGMAELAADGSR